MKKNKRFIGAVMGIVAVCAILLGTTGCNNEEAADHPTPEHPAENKPLDHPAH